MTEPTLGMMVEHLDGQIQTLLRENEKMRSAIKKYLSHQLSHQDSYRVLREAIQMERT